MWNQAKAWGYVQHEPFTGLLLPDRNALNARCLTLPEMRAVIETAAEPYKTYYWILAETGVRAGEIGGLPITNLFHDQGAIRIAQSVWHGKIETVKSKKDNRIREISPQFGRHLRSYVASWRPEPFELAIGNEQWHTVGHRHLRKRKLLSVAQKGGIQRCRFHAFRHGNATLMDQEHVPIATRQNRLAQSDARTTMGTRTH
jgi:integrase